MKQLDQQAERLSDYASKHPWAYIVAAPILLVYIILKVPSALAGWGRS